MTTATSVSLTGAQRRDHSFFPLQNFSPLRSNQFSLSLRVVEDTVDRNCRQIVPSVKSEFRGGVASRKSSLANEGRMKFLEEKPAWSASSVDSKMEASIEMYLTRYVELKMEDLLAFPLQVAELVRKGAEEADSFRQECSELNNKVEKLIQLLRKAARFEKLTANAVGLYERPTRRIMLEVLKALERALGLVRKCKKSGIIKRVMTITTTTDFRKVNLWLESSIGDVTWLLNISSSGDERSEFAGLPPIASTDPVLALVWEQVSIVHVGTAEEKAEAAEYLGNVAKGNERNVKIIIEEGGAAPLLRLLKEGTVPGQEAAATALGHLATDKERVQQLRTEGASGVFSHILGSHSTSMKVQVMLTLTGTCKIVWYPWMTSCRLPV